MSSLETAVKSADALALTLKTALSEYEATRTASLGFRSERDALNTEVARVNLIVVERDKQIIDLKAALVDAQAEIDRLNAVIAPPVPGPVPVVKTHIQSSPNPTVDKRHLPGSPGYPSPSEAAAARRDDARQERSDQRAEDAREDRAAVRSSLNPPAKHK